MFLFLKKNGEMSNEKMSVLEVVKEHGHYNAGRNTISFKQMTKQTDRRKDGQTDGQMNL